jgi:hypothetical protein
VGEGAMTEKRFKLDAGEIKAVAVGLGSCIASDRITVDGARVGNGYREGPDDDTDSGWRFFGGDETEEYAWEATNFARHDVNTIANYDPEIVPFLNAPYGTIIERDASGRLVVAEEEADDDEDGY